MIAKAGKENSLAARLFVILFAAMFLSFIAATALAAYVSWTAYEGDAEERLTAQLEVVEGELQGLDSKQMEEVLARTHLADTRITLVAGDGTVLYDNMVDAREMGSHADDEERAGVVLACSYSGVVSYGVGVEEKRFADFDGFRDVGTAGTC